MPNAISRAAAALGGQTRLAHALGVTPATVNQWIKAVRPVPLARCPAIERATGGRVRCEDLRPDIPWGVLRAQATAA